MKRFLCFSALALIMDIAYAQTCTAPKAGFIASNTVICAGETVAFTDTSTCNPVSWSWSFPGGTPSTSTVQNPSVTYTITGSYDVTLIVTNTNGSDTLTKAGYITVNALPVATITPSSVDICLGETAVLMANPSGGVYNWSTGETAQSITVSPAATTDYYVTVTDANGCTDAAAATVIVNPLPNIYAADQVICPFETAILTGENGVSYVWSGGELVNVTTNPVQVSPANTTASPQDFFYKVTGTDGNGCTNSYNVRVTVNPQPSFTVISDPDPICVGQAAVLTPTPTAGMSYDYREDDLITPTANGSIVSPSATTFYYVIGTSSATGCADTVSVTVNVRDPLSITVTAADNDLCQGETTTLNVTSATGGDVPNHLLTWSPSTHLNQATGTTVNTVATLPAGTHIFTVVLEDGCTTTPVTADIYVVVYPLPLIQVNFDSLIQGCHPLIVQFSNNSSGNYNYLWDFGDGITSTEYSPSFSFTEGGVYNIILTVTDNTTGCIVTEQVATVITTCSGINEQEQLNLNIYPNPSRGSFIIEPASKHFTVKVLNLLGQVVYSAEVPASKNQMTLNVPDGIYILQVTTDKGTFQKKIEILR